MSARFIFSLAIVALTCFPTGAAQERGNGTDDFRKQGHAWFNSQSKGYYCVHQDAGFGVSQPEAEGAIQLALLTWANYINQHSLLANDPSISRMAFIYHQHCDGTEVLRFELGTTTPAVQESQALGENSIAFPVLESFDPILGSGKGYIWIAGQTLKPNYVDWSVSNELAAILLHELGHVLGCDHVPQTIMAANLSDFLAEARSNDKNSFLNEIDFQRQLVIEDLERSFIPARNCSSSFIAGFVEATRDTPPDGLRAAWKLILGREPALNAQTKIALTNFCTELTFTDANGVATIPITLQATLGSAELGLQIFVPFAQPSGNWSPIMTSQYEKIGAVKAANGVTQSLIFRRNIESPAQIDLLIEGQTWPLFRAQTPYEIFEGSR